MENLYKLYKLYIWFWFSSFGIVYALLSWLDDMKLLPVKRPSYMKGLIAIILGTLLFYLIPHNIEINQKIKN